MLCANPSVTLPLTVKLPLLRSLLVLLVGVSLTLTACQYPYAYNSSGPFRGTFTPYRSTHGAPLGSLASSVLGSNRDHYCYVIRGANTGSRIYSARPWYAGTSARPAAAYPVSYNLHPYYSNNLYSSPYYRHSPSYGSSYTNRPWGGGYGFGQPLNWGTGVALGSRWF